MDEKKYTICRGCHAGCSVIVDVKDGRPATVRGNPDHPLYQGFCCIKGRNLPAQWAHPNRLLRSKKRQADGTYKDIPVEQAMDEIAEKIRDLVSKHGPRSVATYWGSMSTLASTASSPIYRAWLSALGSPMGFNCNTIDQPGKFVAKALFGSWMAPPHNFASAKVVLLIGGNPLVTRSGGVPYTNPGRFLTNALRDGLKLIVIDPRRTEVATRAALHLQVVPGQDVAVVAGLLHVILEQNLADAEFVAQHMTGVDQLRRAVAPFTPAMAAERAGIPSEELVAAARMFATHGPGVACAGTGPNMANNTTLLEYLMLCLNSICGRWQRAGEKIIEPRTLGPQARYKAQASSPRKEFAYGFGEHLRVRGLSNSAAGLPTAALAEEILTPGSGQVRALISHGGNPVAIIPDQLRVLEAIRTLDLLVQIDIVMSATARRAHYIIATKHPLEMPEISLNQEYLSGYAPGHGTVAPFAQYAPAVVEPPLGAEVIEDWEFYYGLAQRLGLQLEIKPIPWGAGDLGVQPHLINMNVKPSIEDIFKIITEGSRISLDEVKKHPGGAIFPDPPVFVESADPGWTGRLDAGDSVMLADLARVAAAPESMQSEFPFRLIVRRQVNTNNSIGTDLPALVGRKPYNPAFMHPDDLADLGLEAGAAIEIRSARAAIPGIVEPDRDLRRGLVSMVHGWGDGPEMDVHFRTIGSNTNRLIAADTDFDRYTGMPRMSDIPVAIRPVTSNDC